MARTPEQWLEYMEQKGIVPVAADPTGSKLKALLMGHPKAGKTRGMLELMCGMLFVDLEGYRAVATEAKQGKKSAINERDRLRQGSGILVIDTEPGPPDKPPSTLYGNLYPFQVVRPPVYKPQLLTPMVQAFATKYRAIGIDSLSHFWDDEGGFLDQVQAAGGGYGAWNDVKSPERQMLKAIMGTDVHLVATVRQKPGIFVNPATGEVRSVPNKTIQRDTLPFELHLIGTGQPGDYDFFWEGRFPEFDKTTGPVTPELIAAIRDALNIQPNS